LFDVLNASVSGDTVRVQPGVYSGAGNTTITWASRLITIDSEAGATSTIIDGQGGGAAFSVSGGAGSTVKGFSLVNYSPSSTTAFGTAFYFDQGIAGSTLQIVDCVVSNSGGYAVFIKNANCAVEVRNCNFTSNYAGLYLLGTEPNQQAMVTNCTFYGNRYRGLRCTSAADIGVGPPFPVDVSSSTFIGNKCPGNTTADKGGALYAQSVGLTLKDCVFLTNSTGYRGGAVMIEILDSSVPPTSFVLAALGVHIVCGLLVARAVSNANPDLTGFVATCVVAATIAYAIAGPFVFVAPLLRFRKSMLRKKTEALAKLGDGLQRAVDAAVNRLPKDYPSEDQETEIDRLKGLTKLVQSEPVWPFDIVTLRRFFTAYLVPVLVWVLAFSPIQDAIVRVVFQKPTQPTSQAQQLVPVGSAVPTNAAANP
jgi:hypothetical protein